MRSTRFLAALSGIFLFAATADAAQVLRRPVGSEPESLDPQKTTSADPIAIDQDLFVGLAVLDKDEKPVPGAAQGWDVSADRRIWTFHLRPDAKWSNGDPVTSADFLYSFRRLVDPATGASNSVALSQIVGYHAIISGQEKDLSKLGVEAPDPLTLRITLSEPRVAFPFLISDWSLLPLHRASIEKWGRAWTQPGHLVSNGPYSLVSWTPQSDIVLKKNPLFYDADAVKIDEVHWLNVEDAASGLRRFRAGELDWIGLGRNDIDWAKKNLPDQYHFAPANQLTFMPINMTKGPLAQDVRLREALNLAIDRDVLVGKIDPRGEQAAYGLLPPVISDYTAQPMSFIAESHAERLEKAKSLMAAAGFGPDHPLTITVNYSGNDSNRQLLLAIGAMWKPIGIDLKLEDMEFQILMSSVNQRNYEIAILTEAPSYNDYEYALGGFRSDAGLFNVTGYASDTFDDLFKRGSVATDVAVRRDFMQRAERTLAEDFPFVPLEFGVLNRVINPRLRGPVATQSNPQTRLLSFEP